MVTHVFLVLKINSRSQKCSKVNPFEHVQSLGAWGTADHGNPAPSPKMPDLNKARIINGVIGLKFRFSTRKRLRNGNNDSTYWRCAIDSAVLRLRKFQR